MHVTLNTQRRAGAAQALPLIITMMLPVIGLVGLAPQLPLFFGHFSRVAHWQFLVPLIITIPSLCIATLSGLAGALADRWGRRRVLMLSTLLHACAGLLPLLLSNLYAILATRVLVGIAEAGVMSTGNALLGDYFAGTDRQKWLGVQSVIGPAVPMAAILAAGALGTLNWHAPFAIYALGLICFAWLLATTWEPGGSRSETAAAPGGAFPWSTIAIVYAVTLFTSLIYFVQSLQLGVVFSKLGAVSPFVDSVAVTIASIGVIGGGLLYRRIGSARAARLLALVYALDGIGYVLLKYMPGYRAAIPIAAFAQLGNGLTIPTLVSWALAVLPADHRGRGMGLWTSCFYVGQFLSPILIAALTVGMGDVLTAVAACGVVSLGGAVAAAIVGRNHQNALSGTEATPP